MFYTLVWPAALMSPTPHYVPHPIPECCIRANLSQSAPDQHHLFLTRFGVYLVVFNMEWLASTASESTKQESLEFLRFWLSSIAVHAVDSEGKTMAPICLVGTHKDRVKEPSQHGYISDLLNKNFASNPAWTAIQPMREGQRETGRGLLWFFPCDNTAGSSQDPVFLKLMQAVQLSMLREEYTRCLVPLTWIRVYDRIQSDSRTCITFSELAEIAEECGLEVSEGDSEAEELNRLAAFFSGLGTIMHHDEPSLRDLVVLNPVDFLIKPATQIICNFKEHETRQQATAKQEQGAAFSMLINDSILSQSLLPVLWGEYSEHMDALEQLMVKFGLIVPIVDEAKVANRSEARLNEERDMQYLVPALLKSGRAERVAVGRTSTCFLAFTLRARHNEWTKGSWLSLKQIQDEGFLPEGIFPRLIGKCVLEAQRLQHLDLRQMELYSSELRIAYKNHNFGLIWPKGSNYLRLHVLSELPLAVLNIIRDQVDACCRECVPNLRCVVAVPADGGSTGCDFDAYSEYDGNVVLLDGPSGVLATTQRGNPLPLGRSLRDSLEAEEARQRFQNFLPPMGSLESYDVFLSYRWRSVDAELVSAMFNAISLNLLKDGDGMRGARAFQDKMRLGMGIDLVRGFSQALFHSSVAVPVVSAWSLDGMKRLSPSDKAVDNVLLEWTLMLELMHIGKLHYCLPIFIGSTVEVEGGAVKIGHLFRENHIDNLPDFVSTPIVDTVVSLFRDQGWEPSPSLQTRTIRDTVDALSKQTGVTAWRFEDTHGVSMRTTVHKGVVSKNHLVSHCVAEIMKMVRRSVQDSSHRTSKPEAAHSHAQQGSSGPALAANPDAQAELERLRLNPKALGHQPNAPDPEQGRCQP